REDLKHLLEAARWASSAGNRRIHKFVVVDDKDIIGRVRSMSPGMLAFPTAIIVICTDKIKAVEEGVKLDRDSTTWIDVGTASQNMMVAAAEIGLGTCPTTSFSHSGVGAVLNLPDHLEPEYILQVGHPIPQKRVMRAGTSTKLDIEDHTYWGSFPEGSA
ncbi:MAG: nitroreductase family protein, partial [Chloroflexota bacterium]